MVDSTNKPPTENSKTERRIAACLAACADEDLSYLEGIVSMGTTLRKEMEKALTDKELYQKELCVVARERDALREKLASTAQKCSEILAYLNPKV